MTLLLYLRYFIWGLLVLPTLPFLYRQSIRVKKFMPDLPEAEGPEGTTSADSNPFHVILVGESTVAGVGARSHAEGFAGSFARHLESNLSRPIQWKVYAKSGYTAKKVRLELVPQIDETECDLIVIGLGGNDTFELNRPWKWARHINELINSLRLKFPQTPILFTNMAPVRLFPAFTPLMQLAFGNLIEILGEQLRLTAADLPNVYYYPRKVTWEDWEKRLGIAGKVDDFFSDGVHPSQLTYQTLARDLSIFIDETELLKKSEPSTESISQLKS